MSDTGYQTRGFEAEAQFGDYFALLKPRVMTLVVFTAMVGLLAAPASVHPFVAFCAVLFIAVGGGASGALNMWYDSDIDAVMKRTAKRPIPAGKVSRDEALAIGLALSGFSVVLLGLATNWLAAALLAFTIFFYVVIYTMWLKRATPQNIVIGGAAGAAPPVLGWTAVTGTVDPGALVLFLIIYVWTPPHFWALAIHRRQEYASADIPMLPVTHGVPFTRWHIFFYTVLLVIATTLPYLTGMSGLLYLAGVSVLNAGFLWYALRLLQDHDERLPIQTFGYSVIYLMVLFVFLLADHYLQIILYDMGTKMIVMHLK